MSDTDKTLNPIEVQPAVETGEQVGAETKLKQLGYKQELSRALSVFENVSIALSDVSPTTGVFMQLAVVIAMAGTGAFWSYALGGIVALCVALTMGELGSQYPISGGLYSIVMRVLGKPLGFLAFVDYLFQGAFIPGTVGLAAATYLAPLLGVPVLVLAPIIMVVAVLIAISNINLGAKFVGVFLAVELCVILVVTIAAFAHPVQPLSVLFQPITFTADAATSSPVPAGIIFAAITVALFSFNGYDSAINFSEETSGAAANVGKSVFSAAWLGIAFQLVPLVGIILTAPNLKDFITSPAPMIYIGEARLGNVFSVLLNLGIAIAMFNATIATIIQFSRVLYSSGRDIAWPMSISKILTKVNARTQVPWVATLVIGVIATALVFFGSLLQLVTFGAVLIVILYALIAIANLVDHARGNLPPYRMPFWPLPVIVALVGCVAAISQQTVKDLTITAVILGLGLVYYLVYLKPRSKTHWIAK
jgi:amino acid transporter